MARDLDTRGGYTVADFVTRLRASLRQTPKEEQATTSDEDGESVRLMSIHQAKGLEFPIVVLPDLGRKPPGEKHSAIFHPDLGPLVRAVEVSGSGEEEESLGGDPEKSMGWRAYRALDRQAESEEALRLFYVAVTRAMDYLILSDGEPLADPPRSPTPALALLASRFDRASGSCRAVLPEGWNVPKVVVTLAAPADQEPEPRSTSSAEPPRHARPRLIEIAETITSTPIFPPSERPPHTSRDRPRFVDFDELTDLTPVQARLDRLIRATLVEASVTHNLEWDRLVREAARRQVPAASSRIIAEALERINAPHDQSALRRLFRSVRSLETSVSWTVSWPSVPTCALTSTFLGTLDFLDRGSQAQPVAWVVCLSEAPLERERLRLLLGVRAVSTLGMGPISQAWLLRLGPGGGLQGEDRFDDVTIERALECSLFRPGSRPSVHPG